MPAYKKISPSTGRASWYASFYYTDWTGKKRQKKKKGFDTRKAALEYERGFFERQAATPDISFSAMCDLFLADYKARRRVTSYTVKQYNIRKHLLPYFGNMAINAIAPAAVRAWQTEMKGAKSAGLPQIRVHDLRHSHASILIEQGFSPLVIAERLGHESIQTTLDTYSHLYPSKQSEIAEKLNGLAL